MDIVEVASECQEGQHQQKYKATKKVKNRCLREHCIKYDSDDTPKNVYAITSYHCQVGARARERFNFRPPPQKFKPCSRLDYNMGVDKLALSVYLSFISQGNK